MSFVLGLAVAAFVIWCFFRILARLGFPGWMAVLAVIPLVNLIALFLLATQPWPGDSTRLPPS
jgi:hypothetical protein